jgi:predicted Zn-dependent protease with MMP-like domain
MLWKAGHLGKLARLGKLAARAVTPLCRLPMTRRFDHPPTADEIEAIARAALDGLPQPFASHLRDVVLQIDEYADEPLLAELGIEHPLDLTGVYEGIPIGFRSVDTSGTLPDRIRLFRQAILAEWAEEGEPFEHLVRHILIHEAGHHFGLSDEDMHALEDQS